MQRQERSTTFSSPQVMWWACRYTAQDMRPRVCREGGEGDWMTSKLCGHSEPLTNRHALVTMVEVEQE